MRKIIKITKILFSENKEKITALPSGGAGDNVKVRQEMAQNIVDNGKEPTVSNLQQLLSFPTLEGGVRGQIDASLINDKTLEICKSPALPLRLGSIKGITIAIPLSDTPARKAFTEKIGFSGPYKSDSKPGCYVIHTKDKSLKYVGQSIHLAARIRYHATLHDIRTVSIVTQHSSDVMVEVFVVDIDVNISVIDFLVIFEQYLFLKILGRGPAQLTAIIVYLHDIQPTWNRNLCGAKC